MSGGWGSLEGLSSGGPEDSDVTLVRGPGESEGTHVWWLGGV